MTFINIIVAIHFVKYIHFKTITYINSINNDVTKSLNNRKKYFGPGKIIIKVGFNYNLMLLSFKAILLYTKTNILKLIY